MSSTVSKPPACGRYTPSEPPDAATTAFSGAKETIPGKASTANETPVKTPLSGSADSLSSLGYTPAVAKPTTAHVPSTCPAPDTNKDASTGTSGGPQGNSPSQDSLTPAETRDDNLAVGLSLPTAEEKAPASTQSSDALQVSAQLYPWLYMTSTLDACFQTSGESDKNSSNERAHPVEQSTEPVLDARDSIEFYDALPTDSILTQGPAIMQAFLSHADACDRTVSEALQLARRTADELDENEPLEPYAEMLDRLEAFHTRALELEASITNFTDAGSGSPSENPDETPHTHIFNVFSACLPVLRARISNLTMAQELVDGAQENMKISLRMERLGLLD